MTLKRCAQLVVCFLFCLPGVRGQTTGEITGQVTDQTSAIVASAEVTITNEGTNVSRTTVTNESGLYRVRSLLPGFYSIRVEHSGFRAATRSGVELQIQQVARLDFVLEVGQVTETVEVSGAAPLMDTETVSTGAVIENRRIVELPLNGRDFTQLITLAPNVTAGFRPNAASLNRLGGQRPEQTFALAGGRGEQNYFTLDGMNNTDPLINHNVVLPSIDALQEFKVQTGVYPAEYGREPGQVQISTKSGTNEFHGAVFEFHRNDDLDAKNFAFTAVRPESEPFVRNQFGFVVGGPVVKNRAFFMVNGEWLRDRKAIRQTDTVPTDAFRGGDFSALAETVMLWDPDSRALQPDGSITADRFDNNVLPLGRMHEKSLALQDIMIPAPNVPGVGASRNWTQASSRKFDTNQIIVRGDVVESNSSTWFGRYTYAEDNLLDPRRFPGEEGNFDNRPMQALLSNTRILSPTVVNDLRLGWSRFFNDNITGNAFNRDVIGEVGGIPGLPEPAPVNFGTPWLSIAGFGLIGENPDPPFVFRNHAYQIIDNMSVIRGKHSLKFGGEIRQDRLGGLEGTFVRGLFGFNGQATQKPRNPTGSGLGYGDFLLGMNNSATGVKQPAVVNFRGTYQAYYIDDTYRIRPNLTLNLGLRWEYMEPFKDKFDAIANPQFNSIDDPTRGPVLVRPGQGDFHDGLPFRFADSVPVTRGNRLPGALRYPDRNNFAPRAGLAWRPTDKWTVRSGFGVFYSQDTAEWMLDMSWNLNGFNGANANPDFPDLSWDAPFPNLDQGAIISTPNLTAIDNNRRNPYVLQILLNVQRELTDNVVLEVGYTGSRGHKLDNVFQINTPPPGPGPLQGRRPFPEFGTINTQANIADSNYNAFNLKLQQRYSNGLTYLVSYTWSRCIDTGSSIRRANGESDAAQNPRDINSGERGLCIFNNDHTYVTSLLYDLPFGREKRWFSGGPASWILGGWQIGSIFTYRAGFPFTPSEGANVANTGTAQRPDATGDRVQLDDPDPQRWFNTNAFRAPEVFTFGNVGRTSVVGPSMTTWDFSIHKRFEFTETQRLEFRFEAFNFLNHPNFGLPGGNRRSSNFGQISSTSTEMREIQFGLKYVF